MSIESFPWQLGHLPFIYKPLTEPSNGRDIPDFLPFALDIDEKTGTLIQAKNDYVEKILEKAYSAGSEISGMMDDHGIGQLYAQDFINFLKEKSNTDNFENLRILEIGCGTGYLLSILKSWGADVLGIEPGAQGQLGAERFKIPIIRDFFPSSKITGKFDIIIFYGVLEHISSPGLFLLDVTRYLKNDGKIVLAVPNCEPYINAGDLSFIIHEHWNYYTEESLRNSIAASISIEVDIKKSSFGGSLYAIGFLSNTSPMNKKSLIKKSIEKAEKFRLYVKENIHEISAYLDSVAESRESIGIFVPGRAINILSVIKSKNWISQLRFFDDNPHLHNTFFPGFNIPVESRQELIKNPPKKLIIFSNSFGDKIKDELKDILIDTQIIMWRDIFKLHE